MTVWLLLFLGLLSLLIEFYLPGILMGVIGGIMIVASVIFFGIESQSALETFLYLIFVVVLVGLLINFAMWLIRRSAPNHSIYSDAHQSGFQATSFDKELIGKRGVVVTDLKYGGYIIVEGKRVQAISQNIYLPKGTHVLVIGGQEDSLIVKKEETHEHT